MSISEFGRIGRDAEVRFTQGGDAVCSIPVAVEWGRKNQEGKRPTQWYEVVLWGKQAEGLAPYLLKGKQVFFSGNELHVETFDKQGGGQGVKLVCRASEIKFAADGQKAEQTAPRNASKPEPAKPRQDEPCDDSIPF